MTRTDETRLLRAQGVTAPAGFRAAGIAAGIKVSGAPDLALVFNEGPDHAAERGCLGAVVPVPADIGAEDVLFLEIHQAFGPPSAPFS